MDINHITDTRKKQEICGSILRELPDWFGIPESIDRYIAEVAELPFFVAETDEKVTGFICIRPTSKSTAEIHVMGILKEYHRLGIGKALFRACYDWCRESGYAFLQVKTLSASHPDKSYADTRKFYEAMGFQELECVPEIWGEENPCQIMVMNIPPRSQMTLFTNEEYALAVRAITSDIRKCEKIFEKKTLGTSQQTLLERRIKALKISLVLIEDAMGKQTDGK